MVAILVRTRFAYIIHYKGAHGTTVVRGGDGPVPVSYTHLDVYKRQLYGCIENLRNVFLFVPNNGRYTKGVMFDAACDQVV